jgi:glycosyltransferase involved in cell wall biosynthesis
MHLLEELRLIYDAEALFAARALQADKLAGTGKPSRRAEQQLAAELALARRADRILAVSEAEAERFRGAGASDVRVLGHALTPRPTRRSFAEREGLLLVGALRRGSPNAEGLLWFGREVLPLLWQRLGRQIPVRAAGIREMTLPSDIPIELLGPVEDLTPLYDHARLFVAPTRIAAGLPHKAHEAAARGLPMVTTRLIAGQLGWHDGIELLAADAAPAFAEALARLYASPELWHSVRGAALARVAMDCGPQRFRTALADALAAPIARRLAAPTDRRDRKARR